MINHKFVLDESFQEILYSTERWVNERSGWIVELMESRYINISTYRSLSGNYYVKLPTQLRSPKKVESRSKITIKKVFFGVTLGISVL